MLPIHKEVVERMFTVRAAEAALHDRDLRARHQHARAHGRVRLAAQVRRRAASTTCARATTCRWPGAPAARASTTRASSSRSSARATSHEAPIERLLGGRPEPVVSAASASPTRRSCTCVERLGRERVSRGLGEVVQPVPAPREEPEGARAQPQHQRRAARRPPRASSSELGYLEDDGRADARAAASRALLYGFELQITEMLFRGALENLPPAALAVVFVGAGLRGAPARRRTRTSRRSSSAACAATSTRSCARLAQREADARHPDADEAPRLGPLAGRRGLVRGRHLRGPRGAHRRAARRRLPDLPHGAPAHAPGPARDRPRLGPARIASRSWSWP